MDLIIKRILKYMENFNPRIRELNSEKTEKTINICPNIEVGIFFELFFSVLYRNKDLSLNVDKSRYWLIFNAIKDYFQDKTHTHEEEYQQHEINPLEFNHWPEFELLTNLYFKIFEIWSSYQYNYQLYTNESEFGTELRFIGSLSSYDCLNYPEGAIFLPLLDKTVDRILHIPKTEKKQFTQAMEKGDNSYLIKFMIKYSKETISRFSYPLFEYISKSSLKPKFQRWINILNFIQDLSGTYRLFSSEELKFRVLVYTQEQFFDLFKEYYSLPEITERDESAIEELFEKLKDSHIIPLCPFFPCNDMNDTRYWIILPYIFYEILPTIQENLLELIFEEDQSKGDLLELQLLITLHKHGFYVWPKNKTEKLNKLINDYSNEEGDIDVILQSIDSLLLFQCKSVRQRKRSHLEDKVKKGFKQLESAIKVLIERKTEISTDFDITYENINGFVLVSRCLPIVPRNSEYGIKMVNLTFFQEIIKECRGSFENIIPTYSKKKKSLCDKWQRIDTKGKIVPLGSYRIEIIDE